MERETRDVDFEHAPLLRYEPVASAAPAPKDDAWDIRIPFVLFPYFLCVQMKTLLRLPIRQNVFLTNVGDKEDESLMDIVSSTLRDILSENLLIFTVT